ncbi:MAG: DUF3082 domain-containing protein [Cyanobacteria bacterium P01_G01_bin.54]
MADSDSTPPATSTPVTPQRCFVGSLCAGALGTGSYLLMRSIATTFAAKPLTAHNITALNIGVAVRTLVLGMATLATGVFAMACLGLLALGLQTLFNMLLNRQPQQ